MKNLVKTAVQFILMTALAFVALAAMDALVGRDLFDWRYSILVGVVDLFMSRR